MLNGFLDNMKQIGVMLCFCFVVLLFQVVDVQAGWLIDQERFLASVHGELSCQDCHAEVSTDTRHPNPLDVNKRIETFFHVEQCTACHDEVIEEIEAESHGGVDINSAGDMSMCINCHDPHYEGAPENPPASTDPVLSDEDLDCMACHQALQPDDPERKGKVSALCFTCHDANVSAPTPAVLMNTQMLAQSPHADLECLICHPRAAAFEHAKQPVGDCLACHTRHKESVTHDTHARVSCKACHLKGGVPVNIDGQGTITWQSTAAGGTVSTLHQMRLSSGEGCARCHFEGTSIGAPAMVLPAKGVLCMPCHTATLSVDDTITAVSLLIFLLGTATLGTLLFKGALQGGGISKISHMVYRGGAVLFSRKVVPIAGVFFWDVLCQRRLYRLSVRRWTIHGLIFFPFLLRFTWGVVALCASNWLPESPRIWVLLDKNFPVTAFVFDITGFMILIGVVLAWMRGFEVHASRLPGLPAQDRLALGLIGGTVLVGFFLEGFRIALTGSPAGSGYAFGGYAISQLFAGMTSISQGYGYLWYLHAVLTGAFFAYLPFSRLMHIIMAPVVLVMNAATDDHSAN